MKITSIKTQKVTPNSVSLLDLIDNNINELSEGSIFVITSKVVSICEGRVIPTSQIDKDELIKKEADLYIPKENSKYDLFLTIKNSILAVSAGIDESNANGFYILWPENPQKTADTIREYLKNKFNLKNCGVIITDSKTTPLRWGVSGIAIAHSGFAALNDLIGTEDIFGRKLKMTKVAVADNLAVSAAQVMGEGNEQTPIAIITDIPFVHFQDQNPSKEELDELKIDIKDDVYAPLLKGANWIKKNQ
jgi:putative folate metabolism gamma-glutamate ligase